MLPAKPASQFSTDDKWLREQEAVQDLVEIDYLGREILRR